MIARLFTLLSIITCAQIHGMEMDVENNATKKTPVDIVPIDLSPYPLDVLDLIANFLPFEDIETEQEFIERTKALTIKEIPQKYFLHCPFDVKIQCSAYCPNNKLIAILEKNNNQPNQELIVRKGAQFIIINAINNKKTFHNTDFCKNKKYSNIAISRDGDVLATVHSERYHPKNCHIERLFYKNVLTITNIASSRTESHDILDYFVLSHKHPTIAFNKEGTHIIVHGNDCTQHMPHDDWNKNPVHHHMIIPLTINTLTTNTDTKKTFQKYCQQQRICKEFNQQLTIIKNKRIK